MGTVTARWRRRSRRRVLSEPPEEPKMGSTRGGRPKDEVRREAALAAARELLIAKGYDEVTLSEVARVAGVSRPFVYDNWGSKFALVRTQSSPQVTQGR